MIEHNKDEHNKIEHNRIRVCLNCKDIVKIVPTDYDIVKQLTKWDNAHKNCLTITTTMKDFRENYNSTFRFAEFKRIHEKSWQEKYTEAIIDSAKRLIDNDE